MTSDELMLGVAIAIPQPHATVLTNWRRQVGDPAAELVFPHVTLLPPTPVAATAMDDVEKHLAEAARAHPPFVMHLSGTGTFRPTALELREITVELDGCPPGQRALTERSTPLGKLEHLVNRLLAR